MRYPIRQDHIDPKISKILRCTTPGHHKDTIVMFDNGHWVCSSAHVSDSTMIPNLRTPDLDSGEWVKHNSLAVARLLTLAVCKKHEPDAEPTDWMPDGHLWTNNNSNSLKLCMPRLAAQGL